MTAESHWSHNLHAIVEVIILGWTVLLSKVRTRKNLYFTNLEHSDYMLQCTDTHVTKYASTGKIK